MIMMESTQAVDGKYKWRREVQSFVKLFSKWGRTLAYAPYLWSARTRIESLFWNDNKYK
jgi:hypothetical protein